MANDKTTALTALVAWPFYYIHLRNVVDPTTYKYRLRIRRNKNDFYYIQTFVWYHNDQNGITSHIIVNAPTCSVYKLIFFENVWARHILFPSLINCRMEKTSASIFPDASPWYAISNIAKILRLLAMADISFHCSSVGSTPVGF